MPVACECAGATATISAAAPASSAAGQQFMAIYIQRPKTTRYSILAGRLPLIALRDHRSISLPAVRRSDRARTPLLRGCLMSPSARIDQRWNSNTILEVAEGGHRRRREPLLSGSLVIDGARKWLRFRRTGCAAGAHRCIAAVRASMAYEACCGAATRADFAR